MIHIYLNEKELTIENNTTVTKFLNQLNQNNFLNRYYAVAVNRKFVARANYETTILNAGDRVDIVTPMQGG